MSGLTYDTGWYFGSTFLRVSALALLPPPLLVPEQPASSGPAATAAAPAAAAVRSPRRLSDALSMVSALPEGTEVGGSKRFDVAPRLKQRVIGHKSDAGIGPFGPER